MLNTSQTKRVVYANRDLEDNEGGGNFLPFLDVLFSTMGIFLIIIFLHDQISTVPIKDIQKIDTLIVCLPNDKYEWFGANSDDSVEVDITEVELKVTTLAKTLNSNPKLLIAFTKNGIHSKLSLKKLFKKLSEQIPQSKNEAERITVQPIWWPLNYTDNSYSTLLEQWHSSQTREERHE